MFFDEVSKDSKSVFQEGYIAGIETCVIQLRNYANSGIAGNKDPYLYAAEICEVLLEHAKFDFFNEE